MRFYLVEISEIQRFPKNDKEGKSPPIYPYEYETNVNKIDTKEKRPATYWLIPEKLITNTTEYRLTRLSDISPSEYSIYYPPVDSTYVPNETLVNMLQGRKLLLDEMLNEFPLELVHEHACHGFIHYHRGVQAVSDSVTNKPHVKCERCGNQDPFLFAEICCARCDSPCVYCRACLMMGKVSSCSPLLTWHGKPKLYDGSPQLGWKGKLSPAQKSAAEALLARVSESGTSAQREFLIWAVAGAGKTEMLFAAILQVLKSGQPILLATPRTDVVLELLPRLSQAFPNTSVQALFAEAEDRYGKAQITISTTHQLLRYHQYFPVVIIDEVDAFPFTYDKKLQYAVEQARSCDSLTVYVTATPTDDMKRAAEKGVLTHVKVPRRYHGFDLPLPKFSWIGNWQQKLKKGKLAYRLLDWLALHIENEKQVFLFVARVDVIETIVCALETAFPQIDIQGVHASDPDRREKVVRFREGKTRVLVTTTILERGVTVKGVQVAVLGADERIFDESALVQIAGRAGRSPDEPTGEVIYFHYGKTNAMVAALQHIEQMNKQPI